MATDTQSLEQHCESCNVDIKVYPYRPQGFINWERHQAGEKHQRKLRSSRRRIPEPAQQIPEENHCLPPVQQINAPAIMPLSPQPLRAPVSNYSCALNPPMQSEERSIMQPVDPTHLELPTCAAFSSTIPIGVHHKPACHGLPYLLSAQQNIYLDYPWSIHAEFALEWIPEVVNERLYLRSLRCAETAELWSSPICDSCSQLSFHPQVIAIRERALNGCSEKTNHSYLTINQLHDFLDRRATQVKKLKLSALNQGRALASRATTLGDFKRFLMAVASGRVERMSALVSVALRNGVGLSGILERIERAINLRYSPRSYSDRDFEKGVLALWLGGAQLLHLLHRSAGFPHIRTIERHTAIPQLQASPGLPTMLELYHNLKATTLGMQTKKTGATLMFDEIALKKVLRFDIYRNHILGLCREHTEKHCSVEFTSYEDAMAVLKALQDGKIHLASEVS